MPCRICCRSKPNRPSSKSDRPSPPCPRSKNSSSGFCHTAGRKTWRRNRGVGWSVARAGSSARFGIWAASAGRRRATSAVTCVARNAGNGIGIRFPNRRRRHRTRTKADEKWENQITPVASSRQLRERHTGISTPSTAVRVNGGDRTSGGMVCVATPSASATFSLVIKTGNFSSVCIFTDDSGFMVSPY